MSLFTKFSFKWSILQVLLFLNWKENIMDDSQAEDFKEGADKVVEGEQEMSEAQNPSTGFFG